MKTLIILAFAIAVSISFKYNLNSVFKENNHQNLQKPEYNITQSKRIVYYAGLAFCGDCLDNWSCKWSKQVPQLIDVTVIYSNTTQIRGFIGYDSKLDAIIASYRGSASKTNWIQDFNFQLENYSYCNLCQIHLGFMQTYRSKQDDINKKMGQLLKKYPNSRIIATGHSLGAALATIFAMEIQRIFSINPSRMQIHNYGSPRVGNPQLISYITSKISKRFRVVHNKDLVPHLPPDFIEHYHHIANEIFFDMQMQNYIICDDSGQDKNCSNKYFPAYDSNQHEFYFIDLGNVQC